MKRHIISAVRIQPSLFVGSIAMVPLVDGLCFQRQDILHFRLLEVTRVVGIEVTRYRGI